MFKSCARTPQLLRAVVALIAVGSLAGCSLLPGGDKVLPAAVFMLQPSGAGVAPAVMKANCNVLEVRPVQPAPGFLTDRMLYTRQASQVEYFSQSRWIDVPSRMIDAFVLERLAAAGFATVVNASAPVGGRYRLEVSDFRLLQAFDGDESVVHLSVDATLFDTNARSQLARRNFQVSEPAGGDARSGVAAANAAVGQLLNELLQFTDGAFAQFAPECS